MRRRSEASVSASCLCGSGRPIENGQSEPNSTRSCPCMAAASFKRVGVVGDAVDAEALERQPRLLGARVGAGTAGDLAAFETAGDGCRRATAMGQADRHVGMALQHAGHRKVGGGQRRLHRTAQKVVQVERLVARIAALAGMQEEERARRIQRRPQCAVGRVGQDDLVILRSRRHGEAGLAGLRPRRHDLGRQGRMRDRQVIERRQPVRQLRRQHVEAVIGVMRSRRASPSRRAPGDRAAAGSISRRGRPDARPSRQAGLRGDRPISPPAYSRRWSARRRPRSRSTPAIAPQAIGEDRREMGMDVERDALLPTAALTRPPTAAATSPAPDRSARTPPWRPRPGGRGTRRDRAEPVAAGDLLDLGRREADVAQPAGQQAEMVDLGEPGRRRRLARPGRRGRAIVDAARPPAHAHPVVVGLGEVVAAVGADADVIDAA